MENSVVKSGYIANSRMCITCRILRAMNSLIKSATIQVRVTPLVKAASEQVLWAIGLSMSDAVELFLRRVIVDTRIPFEIIAIDPVHLEKTLVEMPHLNDRSLKDGSRFMNVGETGDPANEKIEKLFRRGRTSTGIQSRKRRKRGTN